VVADAAALRFEHAVLGERRDARAHAGQADVQAAVRAAAQAVDARAQLVLGPDHDLRRRRRRGRAHVGHEVRDREVGLVPDGGDGRDLRLGQRARHQLLVEGPEVLEAAAAAGHDQHVEAGARG
jgi:hypothetical protein